MGKSITPKYAIHIYDGTLQAWAWDCKLDGRPSDLSLETYIDKYIASLKIGGANEHISRSLGYMPIPNEARIISQATRCTVALWKAPSFMSF